MVVNIYDTIWCGRLSFSVVDYKSAFYCTLNTHYRIVWQILHVVQSWREASLVYHTEQNCSKLTAVLWRQNRTGGRITVCTYFVFKSRISAQGVWGTIWEQQQSQRCQLANSIPSHLFSELFHFYLIYFFITVDNWLLFVVDKVYDYDYDHGNDVSIVLSFRDMTTGRTTDGRTDRRRQA